tara:strand:- start:339 stop:1016 length:678 start_codon:yes stop_codon:yes gene_type:complete
MNKINLSIDCVVLSFDKDQKLKVLLIKKYINSKNDYQFALPGDLLRIDEDVLCGAKRILKSLTSLENIYLKQFAVFGHPDRTKNKKDQQWLKLYRKNPNERVVTIGYVALVNIADFLPKPSLFAVEAEWVELSVVSNQLAFDHNKIINEAVEFLKDNLDYKLATSMLPSKFTLSQLQIIFELLLDQKLDKRNFRKNIFKADHIIKTKEKQKGVPHKPAHLYVMKK